MPVCKCVSVCVCLHVYTYLYELPKYMEHNKVFLANPRAFPFFKAHTTLGQWQEANTKGLALSASPFIITHTAISHILSHLFKNPIPQTASGPWARPSLLLAWGPCSQWPKCQWL